MSAIPLYRSSGNDGAAGASGDRQAVWSTHADAKSKVCAAVTPGLKTRPPKTVTLCRSHARSVVVDSLQP